MNYIVNKESAKGTHTYTAYKQQSLDQSALALYKMYLFEFYYIMSI